MVRSVLFGLGVLAIGSIAAGGTLDWSLTALNARSCRCRFSGEL